MPASAGDVAIDPGLVEALSARLCHDLISPVSAINNGLELIGELGGDPDGEALALVAASGRDAARKLQFFRLAFGSARLPDGAAAGFAEARAAFLDFPVGGRIVLAWPEPPPAGPARRTATKLALLLALAALDALGGEGTVTVSARLGADGAALDVLAAGPRAQLAPELAAAVAGEGTATAKTAPAHYAALTARHAGGAIAARAEAGRILLSARLPAGAED